MKGGTIVYNRWDKESAYAAAQKFNTRTDLSKGAGGAYQWLREHGMLNEACLHMGKTRAVVTTVETEVSKFVPTVEDKLKKPMVIYSPAVLENMDLDTLLKIAGTCKTINEFGRVHPDLYAYAQRKVLMDEVISAINPNTNQPFISLTKKDALAKAMTFKSYKEFKTKGGDIYSYCSGQGLLYQVKKYFKGKFKQVTNGTVFENAFKEATIRTETIKPKSTVRPHQDKIGLNYAIVPPVIKPAVVETKPTVNNKREEEDMAVVQMSNNKKGISASLQAMIEIMADLESNHSDTEYTIAYVPGTNWEITIEGKGASNVNIVRTPTEESRTVTTIRKF